MLLAAAPQLPLPRALFPGLYPCFSVCTLPALLCLFSPRCTRCALCALLPAAALFLSPLPLAVSLPPCPSLLSWPLPLRSALPRPALSLRCDIPISQ